MKRTVFWCTVLLLLGLLGGAWAAEQTATVLVYMCGTDLQESACYDLFEMAEVEAGDAINLVVLAGGAKEWALEDLQGGVQNLAVIRDGYFEELENWGRGSMGSPDSLEKFLKYGMTEYPADRTMVILWDHGAGSEGGICFDETANDDSLTMAEINQVMNSLQRSVPDFHINIFGCDACMMATYEMASMLSDYPVDYFVASEELEPEDGWYYTGWLDRLKQEPDISDADLCRMIVYSYMESSLASSPDDCLTLSAVELAGMQELKNCMERFAAVISGEISGGNLNLVRRGRSRMYAFGSFDDASWDMVDLGAVLDAYAQFDPALAAEAKRLLGRAVICTEQTDNLDACCGLSVLLPQDTTRDFEEFREGLELSAVIPNWLDFINGYVAMLNGGHYQFSSASVSHVGAEEEMEGDPISWQEGMTVTCEDLRDEEDPVEMYFWFEFTDIFGECTMSELIAFDL